MGGRVRGLILVGALVGIGVLVGSALTQRRTVPLAVPQIGALRPVAPPRGRVRVEVLNAGGTPNLARNVTEVLREMGFDVVYFGNADRFDRDSSVVLDRVGRMEPARAVADALGIRTVLSEPDSNLFVDVSVLLGEGWERPASPAPPSHEPEWWDLRRFMPGREPAPPEAIPTGSLANPTESGER